MSDQLPPESPAAHLNNALAAIALYEADTPELGLATQTMDGIRDRITRALGEIVHTEKSLERLVAITSGLTPTGIKIRVDWKHGQPTEPYLVLRTFEKHELSTNDLNKAIEVAREIRAQLKRHHTRVR